jgi:ABC-type amino acid transport substrate-binding protein
MKKIFFSFLFAISIFCNGQKTDTLNIYYLTNLPFAYEENGQVIGVEADIIREYAAWLKAKKNMNMMLNFKAFSNFEELYSSVKKGGKKVIGISTVTINKDREKDVEFSPAYLKNVGLLITNGAVPTIKTKTKEDIAKAMGKLDAVTVTNSTYTKYLEDFKKNYNSALKINNVNKISEIIDEVAVSPNKFGYVDVVNFWYFIKNNPNKYVKIQKIFNEINENFGFIMPKENSNKDLISEFFESGFGFTSTKAYHQILEKYLSYEVLESVEMQ